MADESEHDKRLIELETLYTLQEHTIAELNDAVFSQQRQIDDLTARLSRAEEKLRSVQVSNIVAPEDDSPPPHY